MFTVPSLVPEASSVPAVFKLIVSTWRKKHMQYSIRTTVMKLFLSPFFQYHLLSDGSFTSEICIGQ